VTCPALLVTGLRRTRGSSAWPGAWLGVLVGWAAGLLLVAAVLAGAVIRVQDLPSGCPV
jgi:hypothetical protein